ncbi:hypothetical protein AAP_02652 [Ascosphaera apis ARSEF 7405]|uniref:Uncharacterized protein n=1 Tax=Ascosphaera apis ARSEF 7405 TaxID=392613 RepID=A0A167ZWJ9_9EURO|nr:hypothetical protein AAP_02652 [Ascosphaera apis ARSEF 7405]
MWLSLERIAYQKEQKTGPSDVELFVGHMLKRLVVFLYSIEPLRIFAWHHLVICFINRTVLYCCNRVFFNLQDALSEPQNPPEPTVPAFSRSGIVHMAPGANGGRPKPSLRDMASAAGVTKSRTTQRVTFRRSPSFPMKDTTRRNSSLEGRKKLRRRCSFSSNKTQTGQGQSQHGSPLNSYQITERFLERIAQDTSPVPEKEWSFINDQWEFDPVTPPWSLKPQDEIDPEYTKKDILRLLSEDTQVLNSKLSDLLDRVQLYAPENVALIEQIAWKWFVDRTHLVKQLQAHLQLEFSNLLQRAVSDHVAYEHVRIYLNPDIRGRRAKAFHYFDHEGSYQLFVQSVEKTMSSVIGHDWKIVDKPLLPKLAGL